MKSLTIQGLPIQSLYTDYVNQKFLVNRSYQRKLVWTIEEKRNFIDTLVNELPIPLFLLATVKDDQLEIIDGMQRLDAIFSFIEQKYKLKDGYFDLSIMADSLAGRDEGRLTQREPILSKDVCRTIANYIVPISKSIHLDRQGIEETFRRINSSGKHLSRQELRQAGAIGKFPDTVRKLSTKLRGDVSHDVLLLNQMSGISITQRRLDYYSVSALDTFWVANQILGPDSIRNSKDEEIIAFLIVDIFSGNSNSINLTAKVLDSYYGYSSNPLAKEPQQKESIATSINRVGTDAIEKQFGVVFSLIYDLLAEAKCDFASLLYKYNLKACKPNLPKVFHVIFSALHEILIRENKEPASLSNLVKSFSGMGDDLFSQSTVNRLEKGEDRKNCVRAVVGRLSPHFSDVKSSNPAYDDWTLRFENILKMSETEQNQYDFKIGLYDLKTGKFNQKLVSKIAQTLTAISNLGPFKVGYVIVGVADCLEDANAHKSYYDVESVGCGRFYVTGIDSEAHRHSQGIDSYMQKVKGAIKSAPVSPPSVMHEILSGMFSRQYHGKEVLIFKIENISEPAFYDDKLYERHMSENITLETFEYASVFGRFQHDK